MKKRRWRQRRLHSPLTALPGQHRQAGAFHGQGLKSNSKTALQEHEVIPPLQLVFSYPISHSKWKGETGKKKNNTHNRAAKPGDVLQLPGSRSAALRSQRPRPRWRREPPWNAERKGRKKGEKGRRRGESSAPQPAHLLRRPSGPSRGAAGPHAGDAAGERRRDPATAGGGGQRAPAGARGRRPRKRGGGAAPGATPARRTAQPVPPRDAR